MPSLYDYKPFETPYQNQLSITSKDIPQNHSKINKVPEDEGMICAQQQQQQKI